MARHTESLDGGLWTAGDPGLLTPGQLTEVRNAYYLAGQKGLIRSKGRALFGTVSATATDIVGLRDITFDNGDAYIIAEASAGAYRTAPVGATGTFATLTAITAGNYLEVAHYQNRFFLLNGVSAEAITTGSNLVVYLSATATGSGLQARQHGMLPVIAAPNVGTALGTFSQTVTGYYEYWTTEVARFTQDGAITELESAFAANSGPTTVFVSSTAMVPVIQLPATRNTITTHWRVYRSPKKDREADKKFPTGFMIGEAGTGTAQQADTLTLASATSFPSAFATGTAPFADFANASRMGADDTNYASGTVPILPNTQQQGMYGFNLGGFVGTVKGIVVTLEGYATAAGMLPVPVTVTIGKRSTTTGFFQQSLAEVAQGTQKVAAKSGLITSSNSASPTLITLGSTTDRWFASDKPGLVDSDFDGNFMAVVSVSKSNAVVGIDFVKVTVHYGASVDGTVPFPTVVYTFGDITAQVAKNHPPPNAFTGDVFEDSLVLNDVSNPSIIRWSFPGTPEYFPPTYYLDFETRDNDRVRAIKVVNNRLVTWLDSSSWRVNYLPSERDSSFDRGKAIEPISKNYGCIHPMCVATFSADSNEVAAFAGYHGIHGTDSYTFETYTDGLDWSQIMTAGSSAPIALINDRDRMLLLYFFQNTTVYGNETFNALVLSYANGKPLPCGILHMRNFDSGSGGRADVKSAWTVQRTNGAAEVFLGYGGSSTAAGAGTVYRETGSTIPAEDPHKRYSTRRMFLNGFGEEWTLGDLYEIGAVTGTQGIAYTLKTVKTNDGSGEVTKQSKTRSVTGDRIWRTNFAQIAEGMVIQASCTAGDDDWKSEVLILDGTDFQDEDSGK